MNVLEQKSNLHDVDYVASNMREEDIREIRAMSGRTPHDSLRNGFDKSEPACYTLKMFANGFPASSEEGDVEFVSSRMRQADVNEVKARGYQCPEEALRMSCEGSKPECYTAVTDGIPIAMMGVVPFEDNPRIGSIWLLGTDEITNTVPMSFLRWSRRFLPIMMEPYDLVCNMVDKRNTVHIKWLEWLKFSFLRETIHGPEQRPFYEFAKVNHV